MTSTANLKELASDDDLAEFINENYTKGCIVTFSATWCGPCKACKPRLNDVVAKESPIPIGYVYESDLDPSFLDVLVAIKAFPTFVFFRNGQEVARVEGADLSAVEEMIRKGTASETE